jgi:hypothetical protein
MFSQDYVAYQCRVEVACDCRDRLLFAPARTTPLRSLGIIRADAAAVVLRARLGLASLIISWMRPSRTS